MTTRAQRKALQQGYNRRSRERKARRRMMREASSELLEGPAPENAAYGRILHRLACDGDDQALRLFAICVDAIGAGEGSLSMVVAAHDY